MVNIRSLLAGLSLAVVVIAGPNPKNAIVNSTECAGKRFEYNELAGWGALPSTSQDKFGDTLSIGSSIAIVDWRKKGNSYVATLWALPDRGWYALPL